MNIKNAIEEGINILKKNGIKSYNIDSEILMSKTINQDRKYIILNLDVDLSFNSLQYFKKLIQQRSLGKPIAYITGQKEFWK